MTADQYLQGILNREAVDTGPYSPVRGVHSILSPIIREWARRALARHEPQRFLHEGHRE